MDLPISLTPSLNGSHLFSDEALKKVIADTLPALPSDRSIAVVGHVNDQGVGVTARFNKDTKTGNWDLDFAVKRDWNGGYQLGTQVMWSF